MMAYSGGGGEGGGGGGGGVMGPGPPFPFIRAHQRQQPLHHQHHQQQHHHQKQQQQQLTRALSLGNNRNNFMDGRTAYHSPAGQTNGHPPLNRQQQQQQHLQLQQQQQQQLHLQQPKQQPIKKQLSAKELTGAPLISYVPRNRKIKKKISEPNLRTRHCSQPSFYQGQHLYRNIQVQDFYQNPLYAVHAKPVFLHQAQKLRRESVLSTDTLSDSYSISSDDLENFVPRIIRPRRRRKKDKEKKEKKARTPQDDEEKDEICLGSEKQWLPQGLLSAESSYDSRSESASSEDDNPGRARTSRRKLAATLSMPVYPFYQNPFAGAAYAAADGGVGSGGYRAAGAVGIGGGLAVPATSDYSSLTSSDATPPSSSTDHLCDSDSSRSESENIKALSLGVEYLSKPVLKQTKSTSSSFFRSPKMAPKQEAQNGSAAASPRGAARDLREAVLMGGSADPREADRTKRLLRKTNSWHPATPTDESRGSFSLFSPAGSIDLLSGIRKNLSKLELNDEDQ